MAGCRFLLGMAQAHLMAGCRFLLGMAQAGCFPGMWYYLTQLYPDRRLGRAFAVAMAGGAVAHVIVGPAAATVLSMNGLWGLRGW